HRLPCVVGWKVEEHRGAGRQVGAPGTAAATFAEAERRPFDEPRLLRLEQVRRIVRYLRIAQLFQELQVVERPERASERGEHHRVLRGLYRHIRDAHGRQIEAQRLPLTAAVQAHVNGRARTDKEEVRV